MQSVFGDSKPPRAVIKVAQENNLKHKKDSKSIMEYIDVASRFRS